MSITEESLGQMFSFVERLVRDAGVTICQALDKDKKVETKSNITDVVTETDRAVEAALVTGIRAKYPNHKFIGEEDTAEAKGGNVSQLTDDPTWIIDPIDGTMNFVHSNPLISISVALSVEKRLEIGIVYLPALDMMYAARRGKGAERNGKKITVSGCEELSSAMVLQEMWASTGNTDNEAWQLMCIAAFMKRVHSVRSYGSAAINLAFVAAGQADAYSQSLISCWDFAAGALIVKEAGGVVMDPDGGREFDLMSKRILVASSKKLAQEILAIKDLRPPAEVLLRRDHPDVVNPL